MSFVGILKKIGLIASRTVPEVLTIVNPPLGTLIESLVQGILLAEARFGSGNGAQKKEQVLSAMQVAAPLVLKIVETTTGRNLADDALFASGVEKLNDGIVDVLNAFGLLPKPAPSASK